MPFDKELWGLFKQFMGFKEQQVCGERGNEEHIFRPL